MKEGGVARYGLYPGCSMGHSAAPYAASMAAVAEVLELRFEEVDDWNCCGATEYMSLHRTAALALVGRNLALAQAQLGPGNGRPPDLVAPCSACLLNLRKTDAYLARYPRVRHEVDEALLAGGLHYRPGSLVVRHLLDVVLEDVGVDAVKAKVKRPLHGLRVAPYYGCLLTRPRLPGVAHDDPEYPTHLDDLLAALGAEVVDFPLKTHCCGGHMTQISAETAYGMLYRLLRNADEWKADVIATTCPMCQLNLDGYQSAVNKQFGTKFKIPVLYFTQLMGVAFDLPAESLGLGREIVPARQALAKVGVVEPAPAAAPPKRRRGDPSLPMPRRRRPAPRATRARS